MDIDLDGNVDILSGSYSPSGLESMAGLFFVMKGNADGTFSKPTPLLGSDEKPLIVSVPADIEKRHALTMKICTRPTAVDWDGDGKLDIISGNFTGQFAFFKGLGKGQFSPQSRLMKDASGTDLKIIGAHSDPVIVDWDQDGDLDILSGSTRGGVQWSENTAEKGQAASLQPFEVLINKETNSESETVSKRTDNSRIWVSDVNGDGKLDITLADKTTQYTSGNGLNIKDAQAKSQKLTASLKKLQAKARQTKEKEVKKKLRAEVAALRKEIKSTLSKTNYGNVWLYLQK